MDKLTEVQKDVRALSSGQMATLSGKRKYKEIDEVQQRFVAFVDERPNEFPTWVDAWLAFNPAPDPAQKLVDAYRAVGRSGFADVHELMRAGNMTRKELQAAFDACAGKWADSHEYLVYTSMDGASARFYLEDKLRPDVHVGSVSLMTFEQAEQFDWARKAVEKARVRALMQE
jgi:hypothetical protein